MSDPSAVPGPCWVWVECPSSVLDPGQVKWRSSRSGLSHTLETRTVQCSIPCTWSHIITNWSALFHLPPFKTSSYVIWSQQTNAQTYSKHAGGKDGLGMAFMAITKMAVIIQISGGTFDCLLIGRAPSQRFWMLTSFIMLAKRISWLFISILESSLLEDLPLFFSQIAR